MNAAEIRQSFLDFFAQRGHAIVPSSSLMPDSPNLLFTNAGMNQFVPIFLGQRRCPYDPPRAADTQKCIRAGGKHNDLEDVGMDTYHHTFFEMLGNWSFGDYFKEEAINWAWELLTKVWGFPAARLYATVYQPGEGDPAEFDAEAHAHWEKLFTAAGLDPAVHIVRGGKADNFWMMGDTGPCGPCSEIHMDLTPEGKTEGKLVNTGSSRCIELWNLVFIQFNANANGSYSELPARHVDTGMGFERVAAVIQGTKGFTDFSKPISNYDTDLFRPVFDKLRELSGRQYTGSFPGEDQEASKDRIETDIAFRVLADHIRTLSCAIADGIQPGNNDRNYVLRRILRRAVLYGRSLGFHAPFFYQLSDVVAASMGDVFPEVREHHTHVRKVLETEEEAFNKTIDRGIRMFESEVFPNALAAAAHAEGLTMIQTSQEFFVPEQGRSPEEVQMREVRFLRDNETVASFLGEELAQGGWRKVLEKTPVVPGEDAFRLYDTYGFPLDLTQLLARERGMEVGLERFEELMEDQRARARAARQTEAISIEETATGAATEFVGYDLLECDARILGVTRKDNHAFASVDRTPFYSAMGGQVSDTGWVETGGVAHPVSDARKRGDAVLLEVPVDFPDDATEARLKVDAARRAAIERHHTATHLLHWALHEVVDRKTSQKGSHVGPDKLTFDFNSAALTPRQIRDVERLVNERILANVGVFATEVPYAEIREMPSILQFFGDKYGDIVRVVQVGGTRDGLDGFSMELCGGTHTRATGAIGVFRILGESAIAAGIRRIEAVAGMTAMEHALREAEQLHRIAARLGTPVNELEKKLEAALQQHKALEKQFAALRQKHAAALAAGLLQSAGEIGGVRVILAEAGEADGDQLQAMADGLKGSFDGIVCLAGIDKGRIHLLVQVPDALQNKHHAGKIMQAIAPLVGGRGGGKSGLARGAGSNPEALPKAWDMAREILGGGK